MWKLEVATDTGSPWIFSGHGFIGRQIWVYDPDHGTPQEKSEVENARMEYQIKKSKYKPSSDALLELQLTKENRLDPLNLPPVNLGDDEEVTEEAVTISLRKAVQFCVAMQASDGHWPGDLSGPLFNVPFMIVGLYVTEALNTVLTSEHKNEMFRYIYNHQNKDGGWGFHIEGPSIMFTTALNYIALRLLGKSPEAQGLEEARKWILDHGGLTFIPTWGKILLSVLGVFDWAGVDPIMPEFMLVPSYFPVHPGKAWCYFRMTYMPMSYLYGKRFVGTITDLILSLREELHVEPYHQIDWNRARRSCCKEDIYYPHSWVADLVSDCLYNFVEPLMNHWPFSLLREKALEKDMEHVHYEDINTHYLNMAVIEKVLNMLACWAEDKTSDALKYHLARIPDYLWIAEDGLKVQTIGSQTWATAFALQAVLASNLADEFRLALRRGCEFLKKSQLRDNAEGDFGSMYRHISKGAWAHSEADISWQVSDCTAEGLKAMLLLSQLGKDVVHEEIEPEALYDAVNILLSFQSETGGFSVFDPKKGKSCWEVFNCSELFANIVVEHDYIECSSAVIQALVTFKTLYPEHRRQEIENSVARGTQFIEDIQRPDGSWYGNWGICFTYGAWFGVKGLVAAGRTYKNSIAIQMACQFLLSIQQESGGWGESYACGPNQDSNQGWRVYYGRIQTKDELIHRGMDLRKQCVMCNNGDESVNHLLVAYPVAKRLWEFFLPFFKDWSFPVRAKETLTEDLVRGPFSLSKS